MTKIIAGAKRFFAGTEGASLGEYAVALMLIAVVTLAAVAAPGQQDQRLLRQRLQTASEVVRAELNFLILIAMIAKLTV